MVKENEWRATDRELCPGMAGNYDPADRTRRLYAVREGDVVIVESISRFARNTKDLLSLIDELEQKKVSFVSQKENIDTETPSGRFMLTVFAALSQLERETILLRQSEGIAIAKQEGKYKGRKPIEIDEELFREQYLLWKAGKTQPKYIGQRLGISYNTFRRRVKQYELEKVDQKL